jgi:hypothetical protein
MTASPLPSGWWTSGIQSRGWHRSPRRRASCRNTSAVSVTVSPCPTPSRTAVRSCAPREGMGRDGRAAVRCAAGGRTGLLVPLRVGGPPRVHTAQETGAPGSGGQPAAPSGPGAVPASPRSWPWPCSRSYWERASVMARCQARSPPPCSRASRAAMPRRYPPAARSSSRTTATARTRCAWPGPPPCHTAVVDDHDDVGVLDRVEPMGDQHGGAPVTQRPQHCPRARLSGLRFGHGADQAGQGRAVRDSPSALL